MEMELLLVLSSNFKHVYLLAEDDVRKICSRQTHLNLSSAEKAINPKLKDPISATPDECVVLNMQLQCKEIGKLQSQSENLKIALVNLQPQCLRIYFMTTRRLSLKYLHTSKKGICYRPMIIHYCLQLSTSSPYAYDELRYDENHGTGILVVER